ncbi:MAG: DUF389 domain-containing protein [Anaerolineae bacterium]|nr:DUF389 domain-containing protein [Anaerolineae bacterium]
MSQDQDSQHSLDQMYVSPDSNLLIAATLGVGAAATVVIFALLGPGIAAAGRLIPFDVALAALLATGNLLAYVEIAARTRHAGGAYHLIRRQGGTGDISFFAGWALTLSLVGFCGLLAQSIARYLIALPVMSVRLSLNVPVGLLAWAVILMVAAVNAIQQHKKLLGKKLLGLLILPIVALVIAVFGFMAISHITSHPPSASPGSISAVPLIFAAFIGIEITSRYIGEVHRTAPALRTLALSPALAAAFIIAIVVLSAGVVGYPGLAQADIPIATVGERVAADTGRLAVLLIGGAAMVLTLVQGLEMLIMLIHSMSVDGFLPGWAQKTKPFVAVLIVGLVTLPVVWLPIEWLAPTSGLLYLCTLMLVNVVRAREPRPESPRAPQSGRQATPFRLPFHPWIPALVLAVDVLLFPLWGWTKVLAALGCLVGGGLVYLAYGRRHYVEAQTGVTIFKPLVEEHQPPRFRILVPIARPKTAQALIQTAGRIAQSKNGEVLILQVAVVPDPFPLETRRKRAQVDRDLLENAIAMANQEDLPIQTMTRLARAIPRGILETAAEENVDLILMGWHADQTKAEEITLGPIVDEVLRDATCDVMLLQSDESATAKRFLIPTAGGPNAQTAIRLASLLAEASGGEITLLYVKTAPATEDDLAASRETLARALEGLDLEMPPAQKVIAAANVLEGIVQEAAAHDVVLLGVSNESDVNQILFGSLPLQVAARVPNTILVQGDQAITAVWSRRILRALQRALPTLSGTEQLDVHHSLSQGARPGIDYFVLIVLSCIIAALGLLLDSPAVVIGAMLVAPLMSPIMALSLGLVLGDLRAIRLATESILKGVALAVVISAFIGLLSPLKLVTGEMVARARPTLLDMIVALASGMAGAYAVSRKNVSAALPGVSIAAALMPPLATVGLGLSTGNFNVAGGAILLFITNIAAISLAGAVVFLALGIRPRILVPEHRKQLRQRMIASILLLLVIAIPLGAMLGTTVRDTTREQAIYALISNNLPDGNQLVGLEISSEADALAVVATVRSYQPPNQVTVSILSRALSQMLETPVTLDLVVLPVVRSID